jgi:predicted small metal-binding protein
MSTLTDPCGVARDDSLRHGHRRSIMKKTMTCKELGGACETKLTASSWDEMVQTMTRHVMTKHPDVAKAMEKMHKEDSAKWSREMRPKWEAAPDTSAAH